MAKTFPGYLWCCVDGTVDESVVFHGFICVLPPRSKNHRSSTNNNQVTTHMKLLSIFYREKKVLLKDQFFIVF